MMDVTRDSARGTMGSRHFLAADDCHSLVGFGTPFLGLGRECERRSASLNFSQKGLFP
jgi:hypothetical protein